MNVETGKPLKSAVYKTCKSSCPQALEFPACQNRPLVSLNQLLMDRNLSYVHLEDTSKARML